MQKQTDYSALPTLKPPSQDYVESYGRSHGVYRTPPPRAWSSSACSSCGLEGGARSPRSPPVAEPEAPRLFDAMAQRPEPVDYSLFYPALPSKGHLRRRERWREAVRRTLLLLCALQTVCAVTFLTTLKALPAGIEELLLLMTIAVTAVGGVIGIVGVWGAGLRPALQLFFISQMWALTQAWAQLLRSDESMRRSEIFCLEAVDGGSDTCLSITRSTQLIALVVSCAIIYTSMFLADVLSEELEDQGEREDNLQIVRFVWLMQKKSLVGIHRFEELIHEQFEQLVELGYLKLKL